MSVASATSIAPRTDAIALTLADGRQVLLRPLQPTDADVLREAVKRADPLDLRRRFMGVPPPASVLVRRLRSADGVHDFALGAFDIHRRLIGVAQFDRRDDTPSAEIAIEVATGWQNCGLGTRMLERLTEVARGLGIQRFTATYFADNIPIRRLLRRTGTVVASGIDQGEGFAVLDLAPRAVEAQVRQRANVLLGGRS